MFDYDELALLSSMVNSYSLTFGPSNICTMEISWDGNMCGCQDKPKHNLPSIDDVIFNEPATIIKWKDGTKTVVKCGKNDTFDKEKGLAIAICKKLYGNDTQFHKVFKQYIKDDE